MDQWSVGMGTRFFVLPTSVVRPSVGFMVNYVDRTYSEPRDAGYNYPYVGELHSRAVDYGFTAGIDFLLDDNFTMGAEYRYFTNMTYSMDDEILNTPAYRNAYGYFSPIEERDYDFWGFSVRYIW
jgi:long-subunit fatty acid transport protein